VFETRSDNPDLSNSFHPGGSPNIVAPENLNNVTVSKVRLELMTDGLLRMQYYMYVAVRIVLCQIGLLTMSLRT
jgi:hypothetical protein